MTRTLIVLSVCAASLYAGSARGEGKPCVISSQEATIAGVEVKPSGEHAFRLDLAKVPVEMRPGAKGLGELLVKAPLRFTVMRPVARLGARLAKRISVLDGRVVLSPGMRLGLPDQAWDQQKGEESIGTTLPLGEFHPKTHIAIPCEALRLTDLIVFEESPTLELPDGPIAHIRSAEELPLYAEREAVDPLWFKFTGPMEVIGDRGEWVRVRARWSDGSMLRGWIPRALVTIQNTAPLHGMGGLGTIGLGHCGRSHRPHLVTFKIHAHAPIHSGPRGAIWAHTAEDIQVQAFALDRSDGWVQIAAVKGLPSEPCGEHRKIWVHAQHLMWTGKPL